MALKYVVKKRIFGFDKTKTEKYVACPLIAGTVSFPSLCEQVTKVGFAPRGVVKMVLDGLVDVLTMNMENGLTVKIGDFGTIRPSFRCKSQDTPEDVDSSTLHRRKFVFTPGERLKDMVEKVSIQKFVMPETGIPTTTPPSENERPDEV